VENVTSTITTESPATPDVTVTTEIITDVLIDVATEPVVASNQTSSEIAIPSIPDEVLTTNAVAETKTAEVVSNITTVVTEALTTEALPTETVSTETTETTVTEQAPVIEA
jgi:hypothetical protein